MELSQPIGSKIREQATRKKAVFPYFQWQLLRGHLFCAN